MSDSFQPQPPPDVPAPPPSEDAIRKKIMKWLVLIALIGFIWLVFFNRPIVIRSYRNGTKTSATNNLRQIGIALFEFETEYGSFPNSTTGELVKKKSKTPLTLSGRTSNDVFIQLMAAGYVTKEENFGSYSIGTKSPDGVWSSDATALEYGETGFAFISGLSSSGNPSRPILFGPVIPGTKTLDRKTYDDHVIVLKLDSSVTSLPINSAGQIMCLGMDLLDPKHPVWGAEAPEVKLPK